MKILIIKRDKIGDMLLTTPLLRHLRQQHPDWQIDVLASEYNAWVIENNPRIDHLWVYPRIRLGRKISLMAAFRWVTMLWRLRKEHYDIAIAANGNQSPRAIQRSRSIRAKKTIFYAPPAWATDQADLLALPEPQNQHEIERMLALLTPLGIAAPESTLYPEYQLPAEQHAETLAWLKAQGLSARNYVVLGLGARRAKKQLTTEQILRLSTWIAERFRMKTVFIWTPGKSTDPLYPGDDDTAAAVLSANSPHIVPFRGKLLPAIGLVWNATTSIFPDSGLMHFAAASPGGVLGLFAETDVSPAPGQWGPRGKNALYLEAQKHVGELDLPVLQQAIETLLQPRMNSADPIGQP